MPRPREEEENFPVNPDTGGKPDSDNNPGGVVYGGTGPSTLPRNPKGQKGWDRLETYQVKNEYAFSGSLGTGGQAEPIKATALEPQSRVSDGEIRISNFLGLITRPSRDNVPLGALADSRNLLLNKKTGSLVLRHGFSSYTLPTTDVGSAVTLTEIARFWSFQSQIPSAQTFKLAVGTDAGANKHILQSPFYAFSASVNNGAVKWGERLSGITISSPAAGGVQVTFTGGVDSANYYQFWILFNSTRSEYLFITGSSFSTPTTLLGTLEIVPSDWAMGDSLVLYRHFHDNPTFVPSWNSGVTAPPVAIAQGQGILFSGGQSSDVSNKLLWSGYISKTFFAGASKTLTHSGTYVTEAEIKSTAGVSPQTLGTYVATSSLDTTKLWFHGFVLEDEDGQRSQLVKAAVNYTTGGGVLGIRTSMRLSSQINKRIRKIHHFAGFSDDTVATSIPYEKYFLIGESDLTSTGWAYNESGAASGYWAKNFDVSGTEWEQRGEDLSSFLGHAEADNTTVSASLLEHVNNRLAVGRFYDYTAGATNDDAIRFSGFGGNGAAQYNVLPNIDDTFQISIEPGDPAVIRGFKRWYDQLFIVKDNSCFSMQIADDLANSNVVTVARLGSDVPDSIIACPNGIVFAKTGDDVYLWDGGIPRPLTFWWKNTYQALTPTRAWFDLYLKSYVLVDSSTTFYVMSFDTTFHGDYIWMKQGIAGSSVRIGYVTLGPSREVYVSAGIAGGTTTAFQFISTATADSATAIPPYFKTAPIVLDEKDIAKYKWMHLVSEAIAGSAATLDLKATTAGAVGSGATTWTGVTKTETKHVRGFRQASGIGRGNRIEFEYNYNYATTGATFTALQINELGFTYDIVPLRGDSMKSA